MFGNGQFPFAYDQSAGSTSFYSTNPYLEEMTASAIDVLSRNPNGFFLTVENELTDAGGHLPTSGAAKLERTMFEVRELSRAVQKAVDFSIAHPDTLVIVTADHETGGFVTSQNNVIGVLPGVVAGDTRHNATMVPVYASGPNAGHVFGHIDNTDVFGLVTTNDAAPIRPNVQRLLLRQGVDGYNSMIDAQLSSDVPNSTNQALTLINVDQDNSSQAVIRFRELFGESTIPLDAQILAAKLSIYTGNGSGDGTARELALHRLLVPVDESTTFANAGMLPGNGLSVNLAGPADDDFLPTPESVFPAPSRNAVVTFDVTVSLRVWLEAMQNGQPNDFGWVVFNSGTDGWRFNTAEVGISAYRPLLDVTFAVVPEPIALPLAPLVAGIALRRRGRCRAG